MNIAMLFILCEMQYKIKIPMKKSPGQYFKNLKDYKLTLINPVTLRSEFTDFT
ncbi:Uncharacterised protein [Chryseobacterium taihuense]|uniref:Transposase n=1 Tax=Chryseobacterium taihuense TaxID=1141221 RepID=A0A1G9P9B2_9FLAO|nr:hypothetical protein SAMN05216273_10991 [Chryseobacterium taihuense]VFB04722.1 Uncharacterised protein [Chryseobacterium taihuense]